MFGSAITGQSKFNFKLVYNIGPLYRGWWFNFDSQTESGSVRAIRKNREVSIRREVENISVIRRESSPSDNENECVREVCFHRSRLAILRSVAPYENLTEYKLLLGKNHTMRTTSHPS